jgi:hypothetical protein
MGCDLSRNVSYCCIGTLLLPANRTNCPVGGLYSVVRMLQSLGEIILHGHPSAGDMPSIDFALFPTLHIMIS